MARTLHRLLEMILSYNALDFEAHIYRVVQGVATGNPSNYIDDLSFIVEQSQVDSLADACDSYHPSLIVKLRGIGRQNVVDILT